MITPSSICYVEIPAPKLKESGAFYRDVFGWEISLSQLSSQEYWMFNTGKGQLMGGLDPCKPVQNGGVILYLKVVDIDSTLKRINEAGGAVLRSKFEIGKGYGFSALFKDPSGNHLGLWSES